MSITNMDAYLQGLEPPVHDPDAYLNGTEPSHKPHSDRVRETLQKAIDTKLCDVAIVGLLPNGGGIYVDWSSNTVASLSTMLEAGNAKAIDVYIAAAEGRE